MFIFTVVQKYECKLTVFEFVGGAIKTVVVLRDVHKSRNGSPDAITDLHVVNDRVVTIGRDKLVNVFGLVFDG